MAILWYTAPDAGIDAALEFDATVVEAPMFTAEVTEHPVESGVSVSDHVRRGLTRLSLEVVITNTPIVPVTLGSSPGPLYGAKAPLILDTVGKQRLSAPTVTGGSVSAYRAPGTTRPAIPANVEPAQYVSVAKTAVVTTLQFPDQIDRVKFVFRVLESLIGNGVGVGVDTYLKFYDQMVITSLSAPREGKDSINFSIELVEFRTAVVSTAKVTKRKPKQKRAVAAVAAGPKGTGYPPTAREGSDLQSIDRRLVNQLAGISSQP